MKKRWVFEPASFIFLVFDQPIYWGIPQRHFHIDSSKNLLWSSIVQMPVVTLLINKVIAPFKQPRRTQNQLSNRHFYKHGFMADEIEALQSIFRSSEDTQPIKKRK